MSRSFHHFDSEDAILAGTLDSGGRTTGLLIVSGGNEIRSGAHNGMARLAQKLSARGFPVFRYDRRGIGESGGENGGYLSSAADIQAAAQYFRKICPNITDIFAFGNCDASTSLALFGQEADIDGYILANPWVIEAVDERKDGPSSPPPAAIRARYWERIKNPKTLIDLFRGQISLRKLLSGLIQITRKHRNIGISLRIKEALSQTSKPCTILLAKRDTTARSFQAAWDSGDYEPVRNMPNINISMIDSASHSFADDTARTWLEEQILEALRQ